MKKLLLFDIDGTMVTSRHDDRFNRTINKLHSLAIDSDRDFKGYTDYLIMASILEDQGWDDQQIISAMPELLSELDKTHAETFHPTHMTLLPGVDKLLGVLDKKTGVVLGLITGNVQAIARRKLEALNVWSYFSVGAFGDNPHETRSDLVKLAIKKAHFEHHMKQVYVIGDTALDIEAAKKAGVTNAVGVSNGFRDIQELESAGAAIVFEDFKDTEAVLRKLEII